MFSNFNFFRKKVDGFFDKISLDFEILKGNRPEENTDEINKEILN